MNDLKLPSASIERDYLRVVSAKSGDDLLACFILSTGDSVKLTADSLLKLRDWCDVCLKGGAGEVTAGDMLKLTNAERTAEMIHAACKSDAGGEDMLRTASQFAIAAAIDGLAAALKHD